MMHFVYIIYSQKVDQYYIGETEDIENRLLKHNTGFFKNSFTAKTNDWELFFSISCYNRTQAQKIEKHIKKMKSRKYIQNLKKHPNISKKLLLKY
ncbi:GIY-YIG nuclease family protein [Zunongwangia profunda]|uniref:GIY-YIG nuclease family protein n=1 Tax=Zunongwangia profunda TaxID=398743 RepID=UPI00293EA463|nr:GIY-YIG nuclease family protein [Zunongwangia profunda]